MCKVIWANFNGVYFCRQRRGKIRGLFAYRGNSGFLGGKTELEEVYGVMGVAGFLADGFLVVHACERAVVRR